MFFCFDISIYDRKALNLETQKNHPLKRNRKAQIRLLEKWQIFSLIRELFKDKDIKIELIEQTG